MTENLPRVLQNIFGENAMQGNKIAQFGSVIAGAPLYTGDIEEIQALQYWQNGWVGATFSDKRYPTSEETTGINKVITQQLKYLFQKGIPEWHIDEVYYKNSYCQVNGAVFLSLTDDNIGHNPVGDSVNWIEALKAKEQDLSISNALSTGEVKNESKLYEQILRRAHSTFDKSKFTIEGSPSITDDGVASGFSDSNYISKNIVCDYNTSFLFRLPDFITGNDVTSEQYIYTLENFTFLTAMRNGQISFSASASKDNSTRVFSSGNVGAISPNTRYSVFISWLNNTYNIYIKGGIYNDWELLYSKTSSEKILLSGNFYYGYRADYPTLYWKSNLDLKLSYLIADGIPVFNGNKTGLYVAKPDNYEKVGDVVVSDDSIASGFSGVSYIKKGIDFSNAKSLKITFNDTYIKNGLTATDKAFLELQPTDSTSTFGIRVYKMAGESGLFGLLFSSADGTPVQKNDITELGKDEHISGFVEVKDNKITLSINSQEVSYDISDEQKARIFKAMMLSIGATTHSGSNQYIYNGWADLNGYKVYIDGNLVYQPCLKIPYTEADSTSRIVDVAYRDRVQDLYEQTGESLFYTIDEENQNFTLPMADIYGMITKNREILDIVYPIGRPMPEENNVLLDNEVWLEGATPNPVDYPKLFKVYGTKYGGDGITTFGLPDMRGRTLWGSSDGSNGYIEAKLPNIKGNVHLEGDGGSRAKRTSTASGAFNWINPGTGASFENTGGGQPWFSDFNFDASRSSSIYSDDATTVQPPAFKVRWKTRFE